MRQDGGNECLFLQIFLLQGMLQWHSVSLRALGFTACYAFHCVMCFTLFHCVVCFTLFHCVMCFMRHCAQWSRSPQPWRFWDDGHHSHQVGSHVEVGKIATLKKRPVMAHTKLRKTMKYHEHALGKKMKEMVEWTSSSVRSWSGLQSCGRGSTLRCERRPIESSWIRVKHGPKVGGNEDLRDSKGWTGMWRRDGFWTSLMIFEDLGISAQLVWKFHIPFCNSTCQHVETKKIQ